MITLQMKSKVLTFSILSMFVLVLSLNVISALTMTSTTVSESDTQTILTLTNNDGTGAAINNIVLSASGDFEVGLSPAGSFNLLDSQSQSVIVTIPSDTLSDLPFGDNIITVTARGTKNVANDTTVSGTVTFSNEYCDSPDIGGLALEISDITTKEGFGDDENYWYPGDTVGIEIDTESNDFDLQDIGIEWVLMTESGKEIFDGDESDFKLDKGDDKTVALEIFIDPDEVEEGESYVFYAKATGSIDDEDAGTDDGAKTCVSSSQDIEIVTDDEFVALTNINILPEEGIKCGDEIEVSADVLNTGDEDQEGVSVRIVGEELGVDEFVEIGDVDALDTEKFSFFITILEDLKEQIYPLKLTVYNEDGDVYETDEDGKESEYSLQVNVESGCEVIPEASVSAVLESGGKSGEELVVKTTITNTGTKTANYIVNASGYEEWAASAELSQEAFAINPTESADVLITLDVNKGLEAGDYIFDIGISSDKNVPVKVQSVSVTIEEGGLWSSLSPSSLFGDNWLVWTLVAGIGAVFVIIIIVLSLKLSSRKK
ncbi:MAG TPA: putative S-layer protein [Candidatus Nanoarchaeia archaeon]|nr:putative S-layer protein [Candidatus Nanoarchaeia archaeon]